MNVNAELAADSRNPGIDLLRGLMIVLVVVHHLAIRIPLRDSYFFAALPRWFIDGLSFSGHEAVFVFFVISGFLITTTSLSRWRSLAGIRRKEFYVLRFARIAPCLLALITILSVLHLMHVKDYVIRRETQSLPGAIVAALGLHLNWYEGQTGYLPGNWDVLWSLSIEETFYLAFPMVCTLVTKRTVFLSLLALCILAMPFTHAAAAGNEIWQEKAYLPGMGAIAVGVLAALLGNSHKHLVNQYRAVLLAIGCLGLIAVIFAGSGVWHLIRDGNLLLLTISAACVLLAVHAKRLATPGYLATLTSWIGACGRLSYEIYLSHMFVVYSAVSLFKQYGADYRFGFAWHGGALILSLLLGTVIDIGFSKPLNRLLRGRLLRSTKHHV